MVGPTDRAAGCRSVLTFRDPGKYQLCVMRAMGDRRGFRRASSPALRAAPLARRRARRIARTASSVSRPRRLACARRRGPSRSPPPRSEKISPVGGFQGLDMTASATCRKAASRWASAFRDASGALAGETTRVARHAHHARAWSRAASGAIGILPATRSVRARVSGPRRRSSDRVATAARSPRTPPRSTALWTTSPSTPSPSSTTSSAPSAPACARRSPARCPRSPPPRSTSSKSEPRASACVPPSSSSSPARSRTSRRRRRLERR